MKQFAVLSIIILTMFTTVQGNDWRRTGHDGASAAAPPALLGKWVPQYGIGVDQAGGGAEVHVTVENDAYLFIGGRFGQAGGVPSSCVAGYDKVKKEWFSLAGGVTVGFSNFLTVNALLIHGDTLYVGGQFTQAGGVQVGNIVRWIIPERRWDYPKELTFPINSSSYVHAMLRRGDSIFIAGANTGGISVWNIAEQKKYTLSTGGSISGTVYALTMDEKNLYAGGDFNQVSGTTSPRAVRFSFTERKWFSMGSGLNSRVHAIVKLDTMIYAGGQFTSSGVTALKYVARFDTATNSWTPLGGVNTDGFVYAMTVHKNSLVMAGAFTKADTAKAAVKVARWDAMNNVWRGIFDSSNVLNAPDGTVMSLHAYGDLLTAGGNFMNGRGVNASSAYRALVYNGIARWNGSTWNPVGNGAGYDVKVLTVAGDYLYAGGVFTNIGGVNATNVARMHLPSRTWEPLNIRLEASWNQSSFNNEVRAITVNGDDVYIGGNFTKVNGLNASGIIKWNAATRTWSPLGAGLPINYASDGPFSIVMDGSDVLVGGGNIFGTSFIKRWNGSVWTDLPASLIKAYVYSMVIIGDTLFAAGTWGTSGSGAYLQKIHRSGSGSWTTVGIGGVGPNKEVYALAKGKDDWLYAAGAFAAIGTGGSQLITGGVARYKNGVWQRIGQSIPSTATITASGFRGLALRGDTIVAFGAFSYTDSNAVTSDGMILFDGFRWNTIPQAVSGGLTAAFMGNSILVGGTYYGLNGTVGMRLGEFEFTGSGTGYAHYEAALSAMNMVPSMRLPASGTIRLALKGDRAYISGAFNGLTGMHSVTNIGIAAPGKNGPVVQQLLAQADGSGKFGTYGMAWNEFILSPEAISDLQQGKVHIIVKSSSFPNGEMRGQLLPAVNAAPSKAALSLPANASAVTIVGPADSSVTFTWQPSTDPNSNLLSYLWQFSRNPKLDTLIFNSITGSSVSRKVSYGEIDAVLGFTGHAIGATKKYYFTVIVTDGSLWTAGDTFSVDITRDSVKNIRFARLGAMVGGNSTVLMPVNGTAVTFGENVSGQLGVNQKSLAQIPAQVVFPDGVTAWKQIAVGASHGLYLAGNGKLYASGDNNWGQLGTGSDWSSTPTVPASVLYPDDVDSLTFTWKSIAVGNSTSFGIGSNDVLYAWGNNNNGQLGKGDKSNANKPVRVRVPADADSGSFRFVSIAAGYAHTIAVGNNGFVYEWGRQIGVQFPTDVLLPRKHFYPVGLDSTQVKFTGIVSGVYYAIAQADNGQLYAIGNNSQQQLGLGKSVSANAVRLTRVQYPENVDTVLFRWKKVTAGYGHTLAIAANGRLYAWGANNLGMLGTGTTTQVGIPTPVAMPAEIAGWMDVSAGNYHSTAIGTNNTLYGWGRNTELQLGSATASSVLVPMEYSSPLTGVQRMTERVPASFTLQQNFPNPFNPSTVIRFALTSDAFTSLHVYDVTGRQVAELIARTLSKGTYEVPFDASQLSSGVYFYRLTSGGMVQTRKMMLMK
ncbi:MAG: CHRD domain-containing protein [Bacteroidetes bacterium]|nr:CHRD domain-containing protein [Bacteroidota bacterium]